MRIFKKIKFIRFGWLNNILPFFKTINGSAEVDADGFANFSTIEEKYANVAKLKTFEVAFLLFSYELHIEEE